MKKTRKKTAAKQISPWGFNFLLANHLADTPIFEELIAKANPDTDSDGHIVAFQIDNLVTFLKVGTQLAMKEDAGLAGKLRAALEAILDYATEPCSARVRTFLASPESQRPLILTEIPADSASLKMAEVAGHFFREVGPSERAGAVSTFNTCMRQLKQDFSAA